MNKTLLSIIIADIHSHNNDLLITCKSIHQSLLRSSNDIDVHIFTTNSNSQSCIESISLLKEYCAVTLEPTNCSSPIEIFQEQKNSITSNYVQFLQAGEYFKGQSLKTILTYIQNHPESSYFNCSISADTGIVTAQKTYHVPLCLCSSFFRNDLLLEHNFNLITPYDAGMIFAWEFFALYYNNSTTIEAATINVAPQNLPDDFQFFVPAQDLRWYIETLKAAYLPLIDKYTKDGRKFPGLLQYMFSYALKIRFLHNKDMHNKQIFETEDNYQEFLNTASQMLTLVADPKLVNVQTNRNIFMLPNELIDIFMKLKYPDIEPFLAISRDNNKVIHCRLGYRNFNYYSVSRSNITIDAMNFIDNKLVIDFSFYIPFDFNDYKLGAYIDDEKLKVKEVDLFGECSFFGINYFSPRHYQIKIPKKTFRRIGKSLHFICKIENFEIALGINTGRFPARLSRSLLNTYWAFDRYLLKLKRKDPKSKNTYIQQSDALILEKNFAYRHVLSEIKLLNEIRKRDREMYHFRLKYWMYKIFIHKKHIWITFDKMYKAGDNGEYLFKYIRSQNDGINPYYIVTKGYPDSERLEKEGCNPLYYGTFKHKFYFLNSELIAATHANIPVFSGIPTNQFFYVRDLLSAKITCIQHGLTVQMIPHNQNRVYDNLSRYYIASSAEMDNLLNPTYGFSGEYNDIVQKTGLARYDGLKNNDKRQILLIPTWRNYIAMPASIGNVRPYSPTFKDTIYFKTFHSLITNDTLINSLKAHNYELIYVLHPTIASQIEDFKCNNNVKVLSPIGLNYEKILTESSLMITDYSGVQFDFAYMRKPIIYYHPTELPAHYAEGGFNYETQGFGEIINNESDLVTSLCQYIDSECALKSEHKEREDHFFYFNDMNSCKRIYDDMLSITK